jgi:hypothetical protein
MESRIQLRTNRNDILVVDDNNGLECPQGRLLEARIYNPPHPRKFSSLLHLLHPIIITALSSHPNFLFSYFSHRICEMISR